MLELILSMTIWGTLGVFVLWSGVSAFDIVFYRCFIGALLVGFYLFVTRQKINLNKNIYKVCIAGIFIVLNCLLLFKSFQVSTITIGNVSYYLQPFVLIILGIFIYNEKLCFTEWLLVSLSFTGLLLTIDIHNLSSPNMLLGVFLALLAAIFYSFVTVIMKKVTMNYAQVIFIQLLSGAILLFPFAHFQGFTFKSWECLFIIGFFHTILAYYLYYKAIIKTNITIIAILSYLDPLSAITCDILFFNRQLNIYQLIGIIITFFSGYLLITIHKNKKHNPSSVMEMEECY